MKRNKQRSCSSVRLISVYRVVSVLLYYILVLTNNSFMHALEYCTELSLLPQSKAGEYCRCFVGHLVAV